MCIVNCTGYVYEHCTECVYVHLYGCVYERCTRFADGERLGLSEILV